MSGERSQTPMHFQSLRLIRCLSVLRIFALKVSSVCFWLSSYICEMETTPYETTAEISAWDTTYKQIKNFRWMRNQLVHEISIDDDFCTKEDIDSIKKLYELIVNTQDPLSIASRSKQNDYYYSKNNTNSKNQDSVWNKIVSKIKGWLS